MIAYLIVGSYFFFEVNYFLRMLCTFASSKLSKKILLQDDLINHGICTTTDLDIFWHMNNTRYLREFEFARHAFCLRTGIWKAAEEFGNSGVVSAVSIRYRRSVTLFQVFRIRTRLIYWADRDIYVEQFMETVHDDFVRAVSFAKLTFTGTAKINDLLLAACGNNMPPLMEIPPDLKSWIESNQISSRKLRNKDT